MRMRWWQLAESVDRDLPVRKWHHFGSVWAESALSAVYRLGRGVVRQVRGVDEESGVYLTDVGTFVRVH